MRPTPEQTRIPIALRSLIYRSFRREPLHTLGISYYTYWSKKLGLKLQAHFPQADILWTGGAIERCVPGVSDLDFVVLAEEEDWDETVLSSLKKEIKPQPYLPLGEIHLVSPKLWKLFWQSPPAAALWFSSQRVLSDDKWVRLLKNENRLPRTASRVAIALHHYCRAVDYLSKATGSEKLFYRAGFIREITKTLAYAKGEGVNRLQKGSEELLLSQGFLALRAAAFQALGELKASTKKFSRRGDPALRFATEMLHRRLERGLRSYPSLNLRSGSVPRLFAWAYQGTGLVSTFEKYVEYVKAHEASPEGYAYLVSPEVYEICLLGWNWGSLEDSVRFLPVDREEDEEWLSLFEAQLELRAKERALLELVTLPGNLLFQLPEEKMTKLEAFSESLRFLAIEEESILSPLVEAVRTQVSDAVLIQRLKTVYGILVEKLERHTCG